MEFATSSPFQIILAFRNTQKKSKRIEWIQTIAIVKEPIAKRMEDNKTGLQPNIIRRKGFVGKLLL